MSRANDVQFGGNHYNNESDYQVWDYINDIGANYFKGNAIKYVIRAGTKEGETAAQALMKASHYMQKLSENRLNTFVALGQLSKVYDSTDRVRKSYGLGKIKLEILQAVALAVSDDSINYAISLIDDATASALEVQMAEEIAGERNEDIT
jgi:hypothetical protein